MRLATRLQSQEIDQLAQSHYGLDSETLMESAGDAVAEEIYSITKNKKQKRILLLIGPGNNGADGFVVARLLKRKGFTNLRCILIEKKAQPAPLWLKQQDRARLSEVPIAEVSKEKAQIEISEADLIVDAIFGTGLNQKIQSQTADLIRLINQRKKYVIAIDAPSGLNVDTGEPLGICLRAQLTVTFGLAKPGFYLHHGPGYCGQIKIYQIGFPRELLQNIAKTHFAYGARSAQAHRPQRPNVSHKGTYGQLMIIGSSVQYLGAGLLAAKAAGRMGAGYIKLGTFGDIFPDFLKLPEVIYQNFNQKPFQPKADTAYVIGPGLGLQEPGQILSLIKSLMQAEAPKVLLDADALNVLADAKIQRLPSSWILTPHPGELGRLLGESADSVNRDRVSAALRGSQKFGCILCLKGFRTVVSTGEQSVIILSGNSSLAKAGSGDVLSGMIGGLLAQGQNPLSATLLGSYLHGRLGDNWIRQGNDKSSLLPSDLIEMIPDGLQKLRD